MAKDSNSKMAALWLKLQYDLNYSWQVRLGPNSSSIWWCPTLFFLSKADKSHRNRVGWSSGSQWEREKPVKVAPDVCEGQGGMARFTLYLQCNCEATANRMNCPFFRAMSMYIFLGSYVPRNRDKFQRRNTHSGSLLRMHHQLLRCFALLTGSIW